MIKSCTLHHQDYIIFLPGSLAGRTSLIPARLPGSEWQWLEYITDSDGIVCGVCRWAVKSKLVVSETDSLFLKDEGFSNWRRATEKIRDHKKTRILLDATQRLAALKTRPINALLSEAAAKGQRTGSNL